MNLTSDDVGTMMDWVKGPLFSKAHSLSFGFFAGARSDDFTHQYVGKLNFEEGRVVERPEPVPIGSPRNVPHSTSSTLVGVGKRDDGAQIEVTIGTDTIHRQPIVVVKGDVNLNSRGPFERAEANANQFYFTFSQDGSTYTFSITMEGASLTTTANRHLP